MIIQRKANTPASFRPAAEPCTRPARPHRHPGSRSWTTRDLGHRLHHTGRQTASVRRPPPTHTAPGRTPADTASFSSDNGWALYMALDMDPLGKALPPDRGQPCTGRPDLFGTDLGQMPELGGGGQVDETWPL